MLVAALAVFLGYGDALWVADFATFFTPESRRRAGYPGDAGARLAQALRDCCFLLSFIGMDLAWYCLIV